MFILKKKYFFIIESIKDIELKNIKNFGKFTIIYRNKIPENINKVKPDLISTGNIGCIMQIANGINIPIVHTVELIDWYTGGPKPRNLNSI